MAIYAEGKSSKTTSGKTKNLSRNRKTIAKLTARRIEALVKLAGQEHGSCDYPHWPGVTTRLALWERIRREVLMAIELALENVK